MCVQPNNKSVPIFTSLLILAYCIAHGCLPLSPGLEQRSTEHKQVRMYYNYPQRQVAWMWNMATQYFVPVSTAVVPIYLLDKAAYKLDKDTKRAAWW